MQFKKRAPLLRRCVSACLFVWLFVLTFPYRSDGLMTCIFIFTVVGVLCALACDNILPSAFPFVASTGTDVTTTKSIAMGTATIPSLPLSVVLILLFLKLRCYDYYLQYCSYSDTVGTNFTTNTSTTTSTSFIKATNQYLSVIILIFFISSPSQKSFPKLPTTVNTKEEEERGQKHKNEKEEEEHKKEKIKK